MILEPHEIDEHNFDHVFDDLINEYGGRNYHFLLMVCENITEEQIDKLKPYIVTKFIDEEFECAEWQDRFDTLEKSKQRYVKEMFGKNPTFRKFCITNDQSVIICNESENDEFKTLLIPTELFKHTQLAPLEVIVYTLKAGWNKSYANIARTLNRSPNTIETVFKRAVVKMESD